MSYRISQVDLAIGAEELALVKECFDKRWLSEGPRCQEFLQKICEVTESKYAVLAPNGTLGLYLALMALDLPQGSEVIVPSFTFYASAASCVFAGLKPVFVDILDETLNVDCSKLEAAITSNVKAIMPIHIYGQSCDIDPILQLAKKYNLRVIEDAAQALGVKYKGRHVGAIGDLGVFSFFSDKVITTGEGSAITTNDETLYNKLKMMRNQGRPNAGTFIHPELGMNFRITEVQASIGLAQIAKMDKLVARRLELWKQYEEKLRNHEEITFIKQESFSTLIPFRFIIKSRHKDRIMQHLESKGIQTRSCFYPLNLQPQLKHYRSNDCTISKKSYDEGMCLPVHHNISDSDVEFISAAILESVNAI